MKASPLLFLAIALAVTAPACARSAPSAEGPAPAPGQAIDLGGIALNVPAGWDSRSPASGMRAAEFDIAPETELIIYYFGAEGAGSVEDNLQRWFEHFRQDDGRPTRDVAQVEGLQVSGLYVTQVDVAGRFVAPVRPGAEETHDKPGYRMLGAIVESPAGPYYLKLLGPAASVARQKPAFQALIQSLRPGSGAPASSTPHGG